MLRQLATANPELYGSLFRKTFQRYPVPTFALCGHIGLSLAEVLEADVGFGFARYDNPYPNLFFFHGKATIAKVIDAEINAEFTTEGYVHFDAAVKGGYPKKDPWINWDIGLDFEYYKKQFNAEAHAVLEIVPLDFTTGANVLVSNKGLAACLYFKTFAGTWRPGAGAEWGHGPTLYLFGCDVKDYKVVIKHALSGDTVIGDIVPKASAAKAGVPAVDDDADRRPRQLGRPRQVHGQADGDGRAGRARPRRHPRRAARHRDGVQGRRRAPARDHPRPVRPGVRHRHAATPPVEAPGFAALKNDALDITEIVIEKPAGGRWTVETAADSSRLVQGIQADGTRPVTATAKVTGSGHDRTLDYTVKGLPAGSRVEFVEAGNGGGGRIGIVKADGRGTLKFHPAGGAPGKREIQADRLRRGRLPRRPPGRSARTPLRLRSVPRRRRS